MLDTARIIAFTATQAADQARLFYQDTLGLRLVADEPFALVFDANGVMLRISKVMSHTPLPFTVLGWDVTDIRQALQALQGRGVAFLRFEGFAQDEDGILQFEDGTLVAWFKDPDGNMLSLTQFPAGGDGAGRQPPPSR
jgi:catechol 2,3-dioxygenase-like lactoylglutathione lyase family enzyme